MIKFLEPEWHDKLSSTNTVLLDWLKDEKDIPAGFVLAALEQTAGHGRSNHHWLSQPGEDLTFSFLLYTRHDLSGLASLSMAISLGIASALDTFGFTTQTKWPNDLLVRGRKIGGILSEESSVKRPDGHATIVVGVGVNVNMQEPQVSSMKKPATSLRIETGKKHLIKDVLGTILEMLPQRIDRWEAGGFPAIRDEWLARCCFVGEHITVGEGKEQRSGILTGFGEKGQIILRGDDGSLCDVWAGEVE
ncbi:biotin--[acetyl-CoA-carboxylase] ligase [Candidatus Kuenenia sp.]|uniref:biotin--[acetyl-CoA-carboxylase] ligase n=1 Tax=Candidatus Kuenenia sp. TaxID=2499824 RepID=UPI0032208FAA